MPPMKIGSLDSVFGSFAAPRLAFAIFKVIPLFGRDFGSTQIYWAKMLLSVPTPSIDTSTVFVGFFIAPTPTEVPQAMTSPGMSVMSCESRLTSLAGGKIMSLTG